MDLRMPRLDGIEATRRLAAERPAARVIALTTYADEPTVLGALRAGARGYLTKDAGAEEIQHAIEAVARGEAALDPRSSTTWWPPWPTRRRRGPAARRPHAARGGGAGA